MKFSKQFNNESLDLLLDTICNTFGAIILIAILVAIITQPTATPNDVLQNTSAELLDRQIANAEREIVELNQVSNSQAQSPAIAPLLAQRDRLNYEIEALEKPAATTIDRPNASAEILAEQIESDTQSLDEAKLEATRLANAIETTTENGDRLANRLAELEKSLGDVQTSQQRKLRFPKEQSERRKAVWVLFHNNKIYPLYTPNLNYNDVDFDVSDSISETTFEPKDGMGRALTSAESVVAAFEKSDLRGDDWYFACLVNPDSTEVFSEFRDAAAKLGIRYGWEPSDGRRVTLTTSGGSRPSPL